MFGILNGPLSVAQEIGITEHIGESLPLNLEFKDSAGKSVLLKEFFDEKKPVIMALVYYECPDLCNLLLEELTDSLKKMTWVPGKEFQIVIVSINPEEIPDEASQRKKKYLKEYGRNDKAVAGGWHFLTGTKNNIQKLADRLGFGFKSDPKTKQYIHTAGLFVLTPEGKIARTLYGTHFETRDLKLALLEAGEGKIGNWVDKFWVFLFKYDSLERKYKLHVW